MRRKCSTTELHCQQHAFQEQAGKSGLSGLKGNSSMCASVYVHMHACVCCLCVCVCTSKSKINLFFITCVHVREYMCVCNSKSIIYQFIYYMCMYEVTRL